MARAFKAVIAALAVIGATANAQIVRGVAVLPDSATPAAGVLIEARDARDLVAASALSGERGNFELRLPMAGEYHLRGLRVGFQPSAGPHLTLALGDTVDVRVVFIGIRVALATVAVNSTRQCRISANDGKLVSVLWDAVHTALASSQLAAPEGAVVSRWTLTDRVTDSGGGTILSESSTEHSGPSDRPFGSKSPDSLARFGFVSYHDGANEYDAPDAGVFLSSSFAAGHCFHVVKGNSDHRDWVGLAFDPAHDTPGFIDIEGTLWLDRSSSELRRLDFHYTELPHEVDQTDPGGSVEFLHLVNGPWFVSRWSIRMPRISRYSYGDPGRFASERERAGTTQIVVDAVQTRIGVVTMVARGQTPLYFTTAGSTQVVAGDSSRHPTTLCGGASKPFIYGTLIDTKGAPVPNATLSFSWIDNKRCHSDMSCDFDEHGYSGTSSDGGGWYVCGVARWLPVTVTVRRGTEFFRRYVVTFESDKPDLKVDLPIHWP